VPIGLSPNYPTFTTNVLLNEASDMLPEQIYATYWLYAVKDRKIPRWFVYVPAKSFHMSIISPYLIKEKGLYPI